MPGRVHKELVAPNDTRQLARIRELVEEAASQGPFEPPEVGRIVLAVDEAISNIMEHAYEDGSDVGDIRICLDVDDHRFSVLISDSGKEFNPSTVHVPDIDTHIREGKKKGLGIFLMRQIMDEVKYTFVQGLRNELRMVKYGQSQGGGR